MSSTQTKHTRRGKITKNSNFEQTHNFLDFFRLLDELEDVTNNGMSLRKAAAKWNINDTTLLRFKNNPERSFLRPPTIFTKNEEERIVDWIDKCAKRGFPRSRQDVLLEAFKLKQQQEGITAVAPRKTPNNS